MKVFEIGPLDMPLNVAVIECGPGDNADVFSVAADAIQGLVKQSGIAGAPRLAEPSINWIAELAPPPMTVAPKVTCSPMSEGFGDEPIVMVVVACAVALPDTKQNSASAQIKRVFDR
jgi:hypothetical protein